MTSPVVSAKDIRVSRSKADLDKDKKVHEFGFVKYRDYADQQIGDFLQERFDWSIFENELHRSGKLDGTTVLLKAYGLLRDVVASA